ncbi:MAG: SPOR domain-containing protein [Alphaproteobacteria bacterium]|nr:SPOR domain-containing protein [Alphaproteobacteria bacterium]
MSRRGAYEDDEDDDAPWLAPAEPASRRGGGAPRHTAVPRSRFLFWTGLLAVLLFGVVALIYAGVARPEDPAAEFATADGDIPLIRAPDTPYKTRALDGGITMEGEGQTSFEAADGVDPGGDLALDALPEEPLPRPVAPAPQAVAAAPVVTPPPAAAAPRSILPPPATATAAAPNAATATPPAVTPAPKAAVTPAPKPATTTPKPTVAETKPAAAKPAATTTPKPAPAAVKPPAPKPTGDRLASLDQALGATAKPAASASDSGNFSLQLGAFSTNAKANEVWKSFTGRYSYIAPLGKAIDALERDGKTLYRLRATGITSRATAQNLCARLKVAGESCSVTE